MNNLFGYECSPKFAFGGNHFYNPSCDTEAFRNGFYSQIRGTGSNLDPYSKVFPGTQQLGNESGINGPIYTANPDVGMLIQVKGRVDGTPGYHKMWWKY